MAGRLLIPGWGRALDSDGFPIAASISLFLTGTDALAPVYADEGLTTPLTNPVPSNSAGRFPAIWADESAAYDWSVVAPYGPPGSPFTGTGLTTASAADVLAAEAAEAAADAAAIDAASASAANNAAQDALSEIQSIAANAPDAPSVANKLNRDGTNPSAGLLNNIGAVGSAALATGTGGTLVGVQQTGAGAVIRNAQSKLRDEVSVKDFGAVGDGITDDTGEIQAAIDSGARSVFFPVGTYLVSAPINMRSYQTLYSNNDAALTGNVADYLLKAFGFPGSPISSVTAPIVQRATSFTMASVAGISVGDDFFLYDVVADEYDVNRVQFISGNVIYTTWPILQGFATAADIRFQKLNPLTQANIKGLRIRNENVGGGGIRHNAALDCVVDGCDFDEVAYISSSTENAIGCRIVNSVFRRSGATGSGLRNTKACEISGNRYEDTQGDEPITLYKNNGSWIVSGNRTVQYLSGFGGGAGNSILLDQSNWDGALTNNTCVGSATYHIYVAVGSCNNTIVGNTLVGANLGGIRLAFGSNANVIDNNVCTGVVNATDPNDGGAVSAAIRIKPDCSGNVIGAANVFANNAGLNISDQQASPGPSYASRLGVGTQAPLYPLDVRGRGRFATTDWVEGSVGTALNVRHSLAAGNGYVRLYGETSGGNDYGAVSISARNDTPSLVGDGDVAFRVTGAEAFVTYRDFSATQRSPAAPLGAQGAAVPNAAAAPTQAEFNALLTSLRNAKLIAT